MLNKQKERVDTVQAQNHAPIHGYGELSAVPWLPKVGSQKVTNIKILFIDLGARPPQDFSRICIKCIVFCDQTNKNFSNPSLFTGTHPLRYSLKSQKSSKLKLEFGWNVCKRTKWYSLDTRLRLWHSNFFSKTNELNWAKKILKTNEANFHKTEKNEYKFKRIKNINKI